MPEGGYNNYCDSEYYIAVVQATRSARPISAKYYTAAAWYTDMRVIGAYNIGL